MCRIVEIALSAGPVGAMNQNHEGGSFPLRFPSARVAENCRAAATRAGKELSGCCLKQGPDGKFGSADTGFAHTLDIGETGFFHQCNLVSHGDRAAHSLGPGLEITRHARR